MPRTSTATILPLFDPKFTEQTQEESNWKKYVKAGIILTALTGTFAVLRWWFGSDELSDLEEGQALALTGEKENQLALTDSSLSSKDEDVIEVLSPAILREQREEGLRLAEFKELPMGEHNIARDLLNVTSLTSISSTQISSIPSSISSISGTTVSNTTNTNSGRNNLSVGEIAGIIVGGIAAVALICSALPYYIYLRRRRETALRRIEEENYLAYCIIKIFGLSKLLKKLNLPIAEQITSGVEDLSEQLFIKLRRVVNVELKDDEDSKNFLNGKSYLTCYEYGETRISIDLEDLNRIANYLKELYGELIGKDISASKIRSFLGNKRVVSRLVYRPFFGELVRAAYSDGEGGGEDCAVKHLRQELEARKKLKEKSKSKESYSPSSEELPSNSEDEDWTKGGCGDDEERKDSFSDSVSEEAPKPDLSSDQVVSSDECGGEAEAEPDLHEFQTAPPEMLELQDRLVRACELGDSWGVQKLIKGENANPYMLPRRNGKHPFGAAIIGCNIEVVRYFDSIEYCQPATLERILDINKEKYPFDKGVPPKIRIRVEGTRWKEVYDLYTKHIIGKLGFFKIERESFVRKKWRIYHQFDDKALWICGMELCNENMLCIEYHNTYIPDTSSKGFIEDVLLWLYSTVQHYAYEYVNLNSIVDDKYMSCIRAWNLCRHEVKQRLKPT